MTKAFKKFHLVPASSATVADDLTDVHSFHKADKKKAQRKKVPRHRPPSKKKHKRVERAQSVNKALKWSSY